MFESKSTSKLSAYDNNYHFNTCLIYVSLNEIFKE